MKILIISHNVFDATTSMGKTLYKFFETFPPKEIAQIYIHPEAPTLADFCTRYYRITDKDAMKSIFIRNKCGRSVKVRSRIYETDKKSKAIGYYIYQRGRSRTPMIYLARDFMWSLSAWKSKELKGWIDTFQPDIIFLASGDYAFIYTIAGELAQDYKVPLVIGCFDDFYQYDMD